MTANLTVDHRCHTQFGCDEVLLPMYCLFQTHTFYHSTKKRKMIKVSMIITDDLGHHVSVTQEYDQCLVGNNLDSIEQLVFRAKNELGAVAESKILALNQSEYTIEKKKRAIYSKVKTLELFVP